MRLNVIRVMMGLFVSMALGMAGCGGGGGGDNAALTNTLGTKVAPVANAGSTQNVFVGTDVTLDGRSSIDVSGKTLTYNWALVSKPSESSATISMAAFSFAIFKPDMVGSYVFNLVVNNGITDSNPSSVTINATPDPTAPSVPTGLAATQITANSVSLKWDSSTGGTGGVNSYQIFANGIGVGGTSVSNFTTPAPTSIILKNLQPAKTYTFSVSSQSFTGASSPSSTPVITTTSSLASMLDKMTPCILFDLNTGRISMQFYASPGVMSSTTPGSSSDVIIHQRVDAAVYKVISLGNKKYALASIATGLPVESPIDAPVFSVNLNNYSNIYSVNATTGASVGSFSTRSAGALVSITDGAAAYVSGEIL